MLSTAGGARAQEFPGFELERLGLNPSGQGSLLLSAGPLLSEGELRVSLLGHYARNPFSVNRGNGRPAQLVRQRVSAHLLGAWAPLSWLELGLQVPAVAFQDSGDVAGLGLQPPARSGLSTPSVGARVGLLSQRTGNPLDLSLALDVGLPLGSAEAYARDAGLRLSPKVAVGFPLGVLRAGAELGALLRSSASLQPGTPPVVGSELHAALALSLGEERGLRGELCARTAFSLARGAVGVEGMAGLRYPVTQGVELLALGGVGFGSLPGTPLFRVLAGISVRLGQAPSPEVLPVVPQRSAGESSHLAPLPPPSSPLPEEPVSVPVEPVPACPPESAPESPGEAEPVEVDEAPRASRSSADAEDATASATAARRAAEESAPAPSPTERASRSSCLNPGASIAWSLCKPPGPSVGRAPSAEGPPPSGKDSSPCLAVTPFRASGPGLRSPQRSS